MINPKHLFRVSILVFSIFLVGIAPATAMGSRPKPAEPKYKLELTNVGVSPMRDNVSAAPITVESVATGEGGQKYKLEIYKIEMVPGGK